MGTPDLSERMTRTGSAALHATLWGGLTLVLIGVIGAGTWTLLRPQAPAPLPISGRVPDFSFEDRSGRQVERSDLLGSVWIVNLMYTSCPDTCGLQTAAMAGFQAEVRGEADVRLVSLTVDPRHDTAEVLARYAARHRADPNRWFFLTGREEAIRRFAVEGLRLPVGVPATPPRASVAEAAGGPRGVALLHSSRFVLIDRRGYIRGYYESGDPQGLVHLRDDLQILLRER
jgi:protein SCO1/2